MDRGVATADQLGVDVYGNLARRAAVAADILDYNCRRLPESQGGQ